MMIYILNIVETGNDIVIIYMQEIVMLIIDSSSSLYARICGLEAHHFPCGGSSYTIPLMSRSCAPI